MKKVFYLIALAIATIVPQVASADPDLSNYELDWSIEDLESSDGTLAIGDATGTTAYETGNKLQQSLYYCTSPDEFVDHVAFQAVMGSKGWTIRSGYGMWSYAAQRSAAIINLTQGQLVQIKCSQTASNVITLTNADGDPDGDYTYVLSDDGYSYYITMTADGQAGFCGAKSVGYITDIYCYTLNADVTTATYTIKYVDENGDSIKADRVGEGVVGDTISILSTDIASFYNDDSTIKYIYSSDDAGEGVVIAEDSSSVITITFREAGIYSYSYTAVDASGNYLCDLASGSGFEADAVTVFYPEYFKTDSTLWYKGATSKQFSIDYTLTEDGQTGTIAYTDASISNCILLIEGEDIEGAGACSGNCTVRSSMGGAGYFSSDVTLAQLSAGTYTINAVLYGGGSSYASFVQPIIVGDNTIELACSVINYEAVSASFTIDERTDLVIGAADLAGAYYGIDYLYITTDDGRIVEPQYVTESSSALLWYDSSNVTLGAQEDATANNLLTFGDDSDAPGFELAIISNKAKALSSSTALYIDGTAYKTIKLSNGAQNAVYLPEGAYATSITLYSVTNLAAENRTNYWKEVAGVSYTSDETLLECYQDYENPDVYTFALDDVTDSITFCNSGEQQLVVIKVDYYTITDTLYYAADYVLGYSTPEEDATVSELNEIYLTVSDASGEGTYFTVNTDKVADIEVYSKTTGETFSVADAWYNKTDATLGIELDSTFTESIVLTVVIPEALVGDTDAYNSDFTDGHVNATGVFYYEVDPSAGTTYEFVLSPADGETVEKLDTINISCEAATNISPSWQSDIVVADEEGNTVAKVDSYVVADADSWDNNSIYLILSAEVTTAGTYTLTIPAGAIYINDAAAENEEITATYTVTGVSTGINSINAANAEGATNVYSLTGVKMNANNLNKGVYIINGKKCIVK